MRSTRTRTLRNSHVLNYPDLSSSHSLRSAGETFVNELDDALNLMIRLLSAVTGKSPETLQAEIDAMEDDDGDCRSLEVRPKKKDRKLKKKVKAERLGVKMVKTGNRRQMDYTDENADTPGSYE
jgi:hypothetical protein